MTRAAGCIALVLGLSGCDNPPAKKVENTEARSTTDPASVASVARPKTSAEPAASAQDDALRRFHGGDETRGKGLVETFECARCHDVQGHEPKGRDQHCVRCHDDISRGKFPAPAGAMARWKKTVDAYTVNPSLVNLGARFDRDWLYGFLLDPIDLRPHLDTSMPKLALSEKDAADLVAYLTQGAFDGAPAPPSGNAVRGRESMDQKSCASCHAFTGVPAFTAKPDPKVADEQQKRAVRLAPDLRFSRERFRHDAMVAWLRDPKAVKADTLMPAHSLDQKEATDIAAYLYTAELAPFTPPPLPARLPVLERRVEFQEVMDEVFGVTCRHCHSDPDASLGDGGPGNTGGFGFTAKGLDLATYRGVAAGYLDEKKERTSVFLPLADGTPRLLATLLARQTEERGQRHDIVRGMPLGLPALTAEQVQLVESWIEQGRPR